MNAEAADDGSVTLRRVSRPVVVVGALLLTAVMVVAAFLAGLNVRSPEAVESQPQVTLAATASVESRVVQEGLQVVGKVSDPEILPLHLSGAAPLGAPTEAAGESRTDRAETSPDSQNAAPAPVVDRNVVTQMKSPVGTEVSPGMVLAEVSGRPVIGVPESTPLYRDFSIGITGEDVRAMQQLLADLGYWVDVDGVLDADAMEAFRFWYAQMGYELISGTGTAKVLPWRELHALPSGHLTVTNSAGVGAVLDAEHPLMKVRRGDPVIEVTLDEVQTEAFHTDASVFLLLAGKNYQSKVLTIGDLETDADSGRTSRAMKVTCPPEVSEQIAAGRAVTVSSAVPNDPGPAVPLTALNEDAKGTFVRVVAEVSDPEDVPAANGAAKDSASAADTRVDVDVIAVSGGWAAVAELPELPEGTKIRVG